MLVQIPLPFKIPPPNTDNQALGEDIKNQYNGREFDESGTIKGEYIVTFENQFDNAINEQVARQADQLRKEILSAHEVSQDSVLNHYNYAIKGFAAKLNPNQVKKLQNDPRILRVTPNELMQLGVIRSAEKNRAINKRKKKSMTMQAGQTVPWGVSRVNGPFDGTNKKAWIIDSGIDLDHPDLNVDTNNSISYISGQGPNDINGHGTHVAGIIAAKDNNRGVVGVAGATVVAIKVCYDDPPQGTAQCPLNSILDGIDYASNNAQNEDIINMSLWGSSNTTWDDAVTNAATFGRRFALIAGNAADNADNYSPGRTGGHSNIWTASAYDDNDAFATAFSNYGNPPVDFSGPGVDVLSLEIGGGSTTYSGTSQAAPHLAGILLHQGTGTTNFPGDYPVPVDGTVSSDLDSDPDEIAVASNLDVFISGPSFVSNGYQGTWSANASGGDTPYSYEWFRSTTNPQYWLSVGTGSSYSRIVQQSFDLKVRVTDDENTIVTSEVFSVATN